jgi:hypothetical protein
MLGVSERKSMRYNEEAKADEVAYLLFPNSIGVVARHIDLHVD